MAFDRRLQDSETVCVQLLSKDPVGLGFNVHGNLTEGIYIKDVLNRGPAIESGLIHPGTIIVNLGTVIH